MRLQSKYLTILIALLLFMQCMPSAYAASDFYTDRAELATQQIELVKHRINQTQLELTSLQDERAKHNLSANNTPINKHDLNRINLAMSVAKSNGASIGIELADSQQTINWLEKNIQELQNQLNAVSVFGLNIARNETIDITELRSELSYQQKLLSLEKQRNGYLQALQGKENLILQFYKDELQKANLLLKSQTMMTMKQQQVRDERMLQDQQTIWLQKLTHLYGQLNKTDYSNDKKQYQKLEGEIFYADENANILYIQTLIARYDDQIHQMRFALSRTTSITLLNEMSDQVQSLSKQLNRLNSLLQYKLEILEKNKEILTKTRPPALKKMSDDTSIKQLDTLENQYKEAMKNVGELSENLSKLRTSLERALKSELSARQGLPPLKMKTWVDLGREILFIPTLTYQIFKNLFVTFIKAIWSMSLAGWFVLGLIQITVLVFLGVFRKNLAKLTRVSEEGAARLTFKKLSSLWVGRNLLDLALFANVFFVLAYFKVPLLNYILFVKLGCIWLFFKGATSVARLCLVETMQNSAGYDVLLYYRLKWTFLAGGIITALTVFLHQLPFIYVAREIADRIYLLFILVVSLLLFRSRDVIAKLVLPEDSERHPYFRKIVRALILLIPALLMFNSIMGLSGYLNLVLTISWYEGIFVLVMVGYLLVRGLLSEGLIFLSGIMIQHVHNGWLLTEAFLKPLDKLLRIFLLLLATVLLFVFYGWDPQSPIVERMAGLLHYRLISVLNTSITPLSIIELCVVISIFYWSARWSREFVYRFLLTRTEDPGIRNSIAILSQYVVVAIGALLCLQVLGIDFRALTVVAGMMAFGVGLGLRDLINNFACGFLILIERPLRVGDIVSVNEFEGEVTHIGGRAITIRTWDFMDVLVPNTEIFNKSFTNWTVHDNVIRTLVSIKIARTDNPHQIAHIIHAVLADLKPILKDPMPEVFIKEISDSLIDFEIRYFINIRQVKSRMGVKSTVLMAIWDAFAAQGIKPPYPQQEIHLVGELPGVATLGNALLDPETAMKQA